MSDDALLEGVRLVTWDVDGTFYRIRALERVSNLVFLRRAASIGPFAAAREAERAKRHRRRIKAQRLGADARVDRDADYEQDAEALVTYLRHGLGWLKADARALALMNRIAARGIPQVALSDFAAPPKLEGLRIHHRFARAFSCDELGYWKPSPVPFRAVERELGVAPEHHLHIGDRDDMDGAAARAAGCRFLLHQA